MEHFAQYGHALFSLVLVALMAQILNALTGVRKGSLNMAPGEMHKPDYADVSYRLDRTYMNSIETIGFYAVLVFAAILAGASPFWVNLLATLGLLLRIGQNVCMIRGIGKAYGGIRTQMAIASSVVNFALALFAIWAVFAG